MRLFVNLFFAAAMLLFTSPMTAFAKGDKADSGGKKGKKGKAFSADTVPIPVGHKAEGVTLPYFDEHGKLQMNFKIESATRADDTHLRMTRADMETFDEDGQTEMKIEMQASVLDLNTHILTSENPVTIRRSDFEVTGEKMRFNTDTRSGVMLGKVRMLIYNRDEMSEEKKNE